MKKTLSIILALLLAVSVLSVAVFADPDVLEGEVGTVSPLEIEGGDEPVVFGAVNEKPDLNEAPDAAIAPPADGVEGEVPAEPIEGELVTKDAVLTGAQVPDEDGEPDGALLGAPAEDALGAGSDSGSNTVLWIIIGAVVVAAVVVFIVLKKKK